MDFKEVYRKIIENALSKNRKRTRKKDTEYVYYEKHHIIPKCIGGNDDLDNTVLLTAREHYVCHKLLTYIYKGNYKLISAFAYMSFNKKYGNIVSSRDYEFAKELKSKSQLGIKLSDETKKKMSNSHKGIKTWNTGLYGLHRSDETKQKIKNSLSGLKYSDERKEKISKKLKGMILSKETKEKMSKSKQNMSAETKERIGKSKKGKSLSESTKQKISLSLKKNYENYEKTIQPAF